MPEILDTCVRAARSGGEVLLDWMGRFNVREKGPRDLVSEADLAAQEAIARIVLADFPDFDFLGEEDTSSERSLSNHEYCWIVDPLDGTTNYVHGLQSFAVSIGLARAGKVVCGVVYDPIAEECYTAVEGGGAHLNGRPISVSRCEQIDQSLLAASFPPKVARDSQEVRQFVEVLTECQAVRRLGSAALNLCYVAAGRLDGYWATSVKIWDVAAGVLIIQEAGGIVTSIDGSPFVLEQPRFVSASTQPLLDRLVATLKRAD
ncbi:MAG: inositol monophosphatase family protein [Pirellulaceae bacterium]